MSRRQIPETEMRYFLELAYKGTHYHGWQVQPNAVTVQQKVEEALERMTGMPTPVVGSGRTDTGVHAARQYAHFDSPHPELQTHRHLSQLNAFLPADIRVYSIRQVRSQAHARFDAVRRTYVYRIARRNNPFTSELAWHCPGEPDTDAMNEAAKLLLNYEDFACFEKTGGAAGHSRCTLYEARWEYTDEFLIFTVSANRFLRGMVRAIVGALVQVGKGKMNKESFEMVIQSGDRKNAGMAAPPQGLYLSAVQYPEHIWL